jgi:hypothetical protein
LGIDGWGLLQDRRGVNFFYHPISNQQSPTPNPQPTGVAMLRGVQQRRGGRALLWMLIGLLVGGAAGAGTVWILKNGKGGLPGGPKLGHADELALVPTDAVGFVHFRARDVWRSEFLAEFRKIVEKAGPENLALLDEGFVPKPSTLDRVTLVMMAIPKVQHPGKPPTEPPPPTGKNPGLPTQPPVPVVPGGLEKSKHLFDGPDRIEFVGIFAFTAPYEAGKVRSSLLPEAFTKQAAGKEYWDDPLHEIAAYFPSDTVLVIGTSVGVAQFLTKQPADGNKPEGPLTAALDLAAEGGKHCVAAVNAQSFHINLGRLREEFQGLPVHAGDLVQLVKDAEPLLRAEAFAMSVAIGYENSKVDIRAYFKDDSGAEEGDKSARALATFASKKLVEPRQDFEKKLKGKPGQANPRPIKDLPESIMALLAIGGLNHLEELLSNPPLKQDGKELRATFELPSLGGMFVSTTAMAAGMMIPAVSNVRQAAGTLRSSNNLKQIALSMHSHHDAYGNFPISAPLKKTDPIQLSWRVQILPFIEQDALYKEFKLDEPWDSDHNKKLIDRMPKTYQSPLAIAPPGQTYYKVFSGDEAIFGPGKKTSIPQIRDGIVNTILAVEGGEPVIWTKPDDIPFDPKMPLPDLSLIGNRRINIVMADGSTRNIDLDRVSEKTLKALITMAGGEKIGVEDIEP